MRGRVVGALVILAAMTLAASTAPRVTPPRSPERSEREEEGAELELSGEEHDAGDVGGFRCSEPAGLAFRPVRPCEPQAVASGALAAKRFRFDRVLVGRGGDTEATIAFGPKSSVLACSHGAFFAPSSVWSSPDAGRTWKRTDPAPNPIVSGDCDLTVMDDGTWVVVFDTIANATVATSRDRGKTWTVNPITALPVGVDRPWIVADGERLVMAYADPQIDGPALHFVSVSTDGGATFPEQHLVNAFDLPDRPNGVMGRPTVTGRTIRVPVSMMNSRSLGPAYLYLVTSTDAGNTWERTLVHDAYLTSVHFATLAVARDRTIYMGLAAGSRLADDMTVSVLASTDDGRSWRQIDLAKHVVFPQITKVASVWVDARPDGTATAVWLAQTSRGREVWAARLGAKGVIVPAQAISAPVDDEGSFEFITVDHDAKGRAHVVAPLDTGPACHGLPDQPIVHRLTQCVYDFVER